MNRRLRRPFAQYIAAASLLAFTACSGILDVDDTDNPNVVDATDIGPDDIATLAQSSQQDWREAYPWLIYYTSYFTGEMLVAETGPLTNQAGRRDIQPDEGELTSEIWGPLSAARASAVQVLGFLEETGGINSDINSARVSLVAGLAFLYMADVFCQGAVDGGPPLQTTAMLDSAVTHFSRAISVANANSGTEATQLENAALVGRARAHLQAGNAGEAVADAQAVEAGFVWLTPYVEEAADKALEDHRLGNMLYDRTYIGRRGLSVAPAFRNLGDPRVPSLPPSEHAVPPFDAVTEYWVQTKFTSWDAPIRLASKLEADYIAAEAQGGQAALDLIQRERAANGQPAYSGPTDEESLLTELILQRSREFYLEGRRMGDFRRHPDKVQDMPQPGAPYHKSGFSPISDQTCFPLPFAETNNNPNF